MANLVEITSNEQFTGIVEGREHVDRVMVLNFWAPWAEPCTAMNDVFVELARKHEKDGLLFLKVEAEQVPDVAESFEVEAVPSFVVLRKKKILARISGANAAELAATVLMHSRPKARGAQSTTTREPPKPTTTTTTPVTADLTAPVNGHAGTDMETDGGLNSRLEALTKQAPVMLFMKGTPELPRCGFSQKMVGMFQEQGVAFSTFDILGDESVRQGMKTFSDWPTFPQVYIGGEFVGGLDVVKEMVDSGEFKEMATEAGAL